MSVRIHYSKADGMFFLDFKMFENGYTTSQPLNKEVFEELIALFKNEGKIQKVLRGMNRDLPCHSCHQYHKINNSDKWICDKGLKPKPVCLYYEKMGDINEKEV